MKYLGNILYIGGFELPDKNAAAQRVIANSKILKSLGHHIFLVGLSKDIKVERLDVEDFEGFNYYNLKYPTKLTQWYNYLISIKHLKKIIKENQIDCVIAYNYPGVALLNLYRYTKKHKIKLLGDCTEWYEAQGNIVFRLIKKIDVNIRMRFVHPQLDGMIVISNYLYKYYRKYNKPIINIPPLVDLSMPKWTEKKNVFTNDTINLIYAGSPGSGNKDRLDQIIEAIEQVNSQTTRRIILTIVGLTLDGYIKSFQNVKIKKTSQFLFKGRLSHIDTLNEIKKSDFQIFIRENSLTNTAGFPTKFVEAISCGTPVLTNPTSNILDFFEEGKTGFLLESSPEKLFVQTLLEISKLNREKINNMKEYCRQSRKFDIINYRSNVEIFIKQIIE